MASESQQLSTQVESESEEKDLKGALRQRARSSKRIAWLLDECIPIPFTKRRIGLDPIIGLIPYGGETIATLIGATVLGESVKRGIPLKTLIRMGANMLINAVVGVIPAAGDLFSAWFKSNSRNYEMLNEFLQSDEAKEAEGGWWPVTLVFLIIGIILSINILSFVFFFAIINEMVEYIWS